ncbi:small integral membrane protein 8 isoform X2 [Rhinoraja longicauda]
MCSSELKINAAIQQESVLKLSLMNLREEYEKKITEEIEKVREEEKVEAEAPIILLQSRHQSEIDYLKDLLCDKEESLKEIFERVETMTILEMELENELRETRSAFQDYINLTYPKLPPEQVEFILPPRQMCLHSHNPLCSVKPHKAQKRPQK